MQNKEQNALLVHRENYEVPKGQEQVVHYKIAKLDSTGKVLEPARIVKDDPKYFETVLKRNLENMGYTVEILHHPQGRYSSVKIETAEARLAEKDAEIARLKAELAKMQEAKVETKTEAKVETKEEAPKAPKAPKGKK